MTKTLYTPKPSITLLRRSQKLADELARNFEPFPTSIKGRGIVTCAGGYRYFPSAWVLIRMLRHLGCKLPIQLWHLGSAEVSKKMKRLVADYGVECVDGLPMLQRNIHYKNEKVKTGWVLKSVAVTRCPFEEVMFLDADNLPVRDPSYLFDIPQYKVTGALFWPDSSVFVPKSVWRVFRVPPKDEPEFESGQFVIDKRINWEALLLAEKFNFRADIFYRLMWGDKDTFRFAWHKLGRSFAIPNFPPQALRAAGSEADMLCHHDFQGDRIFQHRIMYKWNLFGENPWIPGFFLENECRTFLEELKSVWNGRCNNHTHQPQGVGDRRALLKTVWLLEAPKIPQKKERPKDVPGKPSPPLDNSKNWIEIKFSKNGTLCKGANREAGVVYWDFKNLAGNSQLILSDEKGPRIKLKQRKSGWRGLWSNGAHETTTKMLALEDVYPHLKAGTGRMTPQTCAEIRAHFPGETHLFHPGMGIGDHISAAYACTGLARTGVRVTFHSPLATWLARINEPGLTITKEPAKRGAYNLNYDYLNQLRYAKSRALWYAGGLHPELKPAMPKVDRKQTKKRLPFQRYVLISPYATHSVREWVDIHWIRLAHLLRDAGFEVVAMGARIDAERLQKTFGDTHAYWVTHHPPDWITDAMLGCVAYVGIDSGITHLAALMGIKTIAIHSQLKADFLWPTGSVKSIAPDAACSFCRWQEEGGWVSTCKDSCSLLTSINPETVVEAVLEGESHGQPKSIAPVTSYVSRV